MQLCSFWAWPWFPCLCIWQGGKEIRPRIPRTREFCCKIECVFGWSLLEEKSPEQLNSTLLSWHPYLLSFCCIISFFLLTRVHWWVWSLICACCTLYIRIHLLLNHLRQPNCIAVGFSLFFFFFLPFFFFFVLFWAFIDNKLHLHLSSFKKRKTQGLDSFFLKTACTSEWSDLELIRKRKIKISSNLTKQRSVLDILFR